MTYKFLPPQQQEPIIVNGQEYLKLGTSQRKGTPSRQYILLDRETANTNAAITIADLQLLKKKCKGPVTTSKEPKNKRLSTGQIYKLCNGATIRFCQTDDKTSEGNVGTIQLHKTRFTVVRRTKEVSSPHPHQDPGHLHRDTPTNSPTHTGSHPGEGHLERGHVAPTHRDTPTNSPTHTGLHPGEGHLERGHLAPTQNPISGTSTFRPQQPNQEDANNSSAKYHPQTTSPATQQSETGNMKQRPDAADAGNFLRRQIKSPGDFSRSNTKAFLKFEDEIDQESIRDNATAKRLRKKAPSKISLASTLVRNTLLFHEDIQAGQCSRYQCQKPRICFLARKSKQAAGSLYDSWKCYKPPPRREGL